jgi:multicomponent K+:H+ antiporter subunit E
VSVELDSEGGVLVVHALDADDDESVRREIKTRYEARLKEIFEC